MAQGALLEQLPLGKAVLRPRFDDARSRLELAKSHAGGDFYLVGRGMQLGAEFLHKQRRPEEAKVKARPRFLRS